MAEREPASWEKAFLASFRLTGNVSRSAEHAGRCRAHVYRMRNQHPDFAAAMDDAQEAFVDMLEEEAKRRACDGVVRFRFKPSGEPIEDPVRCRCEHDVAQHEGHEGRCLAGGCSCGKYHGQPYFELLRSDPLLQMLLRGGRPAKYLERLNISSEELNAIIRQQLEEWRLAGLADPGPGGVAGAPAGPEPGPAAAGGGGPGPAPVR